MHFFTQCFIIDVFNSFEKYIKKLRTMSAIHMVFIAGNTILLEEIKRRKSVFLLEICGSTRIQKFWGTIIFPYFPLIWTLNWGRVPIGTTGTPYTPCPAPAHTSAMSGWEHSFPARGTAASGARGLQGQGPRYEGGGLKLGQDQLGRRRPRQGRAWSTPLSPLFLVCPSGVVVVWGFFLTCD